MPTPRKSNDDRKKKALAIKENKKNLKLINDSIKSALKEDNIKKLEGLEKKYILTFGGEHGMSAFFYACHVSTFETLKWLFETISELLKSYLDPEDADEAFTDFFFQTFWDNDDKPYHPGTILLIRCREKSFNFDNFCWLNEKLQAFEFNLEKRGIINSIASEYGSSFQGFLKEEAPINRPPRSFAQERERQLLKQFSTVLFFEIKQILIENKEPAKNLVEIQTMHIRINEKSYLFVAANKTNITNYFENVTNAKKLKEILINDNKGRNNLTAKNRLKRYTDNFKYGIYDEETDLYYSDTEDKEIDITNFNAIKALLNSKKKVKHLALQYETSKGEGKKPLVPVVIEGIKNIFNKSPQIVFLDTSDCKGSYKDRHAEEFLIDIADIAISIADSQNISMCVGGKKRPCITCYGRMTHFKEKQKNKETLKFGQNPGLLWLKPLETQDDETKKTTYKAFIEKKSHATLSSSEKLITDYDSSTEEEDQIYSRFDL